MTEQPSDISKFHQFDPATASRPALDHELGRLSSRLQGLSKRMEDIQFFKDYLQEEQPKFIKIAVSTHLDKEKGYILDRHFTMDLDTESIEVVRNFSDVSESLLKNEIAFAKNYLRALLDHY